MGNDNGEYNITIKNWERFNPKRDQKTYTWLRLNNAIATDPDLFGLTAAQKYVWIVILCEASKKNTGDVTLPVEYLTHTTGVNESDIGVLFEFLEKKQIVIIHDRPRPRDVVYTTPTYERTNVRTNETNVRGNTAARGRKDTEKKDTSVKEFIAHYVDTYRLRYGEKANPPIGGKNAGIAKRLVKDLGIERAKALLLTYLEMEDNWFVTKGHDLVTFEQNLTNIARRHDTNFEAVPYVRTKQQIVSQNNADLFAKVDRGEA